MWGKMTRWPRNSDQHTFADSSIVAQLPLKDFYIYTVTPQNIVIIKLVNYMC